MNNSVKLLVFIVYFIFVVTVLGMIDSGLFRLIVGILLWMVYFNITKGDL